MSMMPAFSPGPCTTSLLRVGSRFKCTRDDLYEQCSLHITLKMPSSVSVGSRPPRSCLIFAYSSGVKPCSWTSSEVMTGVADRLIVGLEDYCRISGRGRVEKASSICRCLTAIFGGKVVYGIPGHWAF